jgi:hypothetical protein
MTRHLPAPPSITRRRHQQPATLLSQPRTLSAATDLPGIAGPWGPPKAEFQEKMTAGACIHCPDSY